MINKNPTLRELETLWELCCEFLEREQIRSVRDCFSDAAYEEATPLLSDICDITGYYEEEDDSECYTCRGTGEGQYDGQRCYQCKGTGVDKYED